ncbi:MAG: hypothetical protein QXS74_08750 [Nitrososphaeria archaeon]
MVESHSPQPKVGDIIKVID